MEIDARLHQIEEILVVLQQAVLQLQRDMMRRLVEGDHAG